MATRARILADYVSSGDELALKAPLASPAFTGTPTVITAAHITSGALPVGVTGGSGLTHLASNPTVTLGSNATFPAGHVTKVHVHPLANDVNCTGSGYTTYQTVVISPSSGTSKLYVSHTMHASQGDGGNANFQQELAFSGSNITDGTYLTSEAYQYTSASVWRVRTFMYKEIALDGTASDVTLLFKVNHSHANNTTYVIGNNINETSVTVIEIY